MPDMVRNDETEMSLILAEPTLIVTVKFFEKKLQKKKLYSTFNEHICGLHTAHQVPQDASHLHS